MNNPTQESQPLYPSLSSPTAKGSTESSHDHQASLSSSPAKQETQPHEPAPSSSSPPLCEDSSEKWPGTHIMGQPAVPTCHPDNKKAALWGAGDQAQYHHHPYLQFNPIEKSSNSPMESILHKFNSWSSKAESMANNIWHNLKTNSSVSGAAWGKMNLTAKAITGGGFESLYKQTFTTYPNEKLKKTFASYLSTSTGPVAGTLYLSDVHVAFCSDRPLSFTAPSGQETWSYYKVMIPLGKIGAINPVLMRENPSEKYIQVITIDGHDFWFMGFVNFDKATKHLSESISTFLASGMAVKPVVA
ncbi:hypothetical protein I3843_03G003000 [Carya illinoinensis]|uniref:GRAM domain-containing protein n=1 Tax=Carya illinoinensis TaxID=32201 RepID=A0A922A5A9_CARIL|nr:hypothetical protein I3760_Q003000 [Carya illinoinensis]KAG6621785.1 hypothetical protein I3842_Q003000 [Carya illinoinensis]KAG7985008.1 hypothetical protein I3843_03G003000 [Carya illinoinensis]